MYIVEIGYGESTFSSSNYINTVKFPNRIKAKQFVFDFISKYDSSVDNYFGPNDIRGSVYFYPQDKGCIVFKIRKLE